MPPDFSGIARLAIFGLLVGIPATIAWVVVGTVYLIRHLGWR